MLGINVRDGEDINRAVKRFSSLCEYNGLISDIRSLKDRYEKPSETKRKKKNKANYDRKKQQKKNNRKLY